MASIVTDKIYFLKLFNQELPSVSCETCLVLSSGRIIDRSSSESSIIAFSALPENIAVLAQSGQKHVLNARLKDNRLCQCQVEVTHSQFEDERLILLWLPILKESETLREDAIFRSMIFESGTLVIVDRDLLTIQELCQRIPVRITNGQDKVSPASTALFAAATNTAWHSGGLKKIKPMFCQHILFGSDVFKVNKTGRLMEDVAHELSGEGVDVAELSSCLPWKISYIHQ